MTQRTAIRVFFGISLTVWLFAMGLLYYTHFLKKHDEELGYATSNVELDSSKSQYFSISIDGQRVGYRIETWFKRGQHVFCNEENVIKMNLAGLSREVFSQCVVSIDTTTQITDTMEFSLQSGAHLSSFSGRISNDSLYINVKKDIFSPAGAGVFEVDNSVTFPVSLPYFMHRKNLEMMSFAVFDPMTFTDYLVNCTWCGIEKQKVGPHTFDLERYDLIYKNQRCTMWLDGEGRLIKADGYLLFGGELGNMSIERSWTRDVFNLPIEVNVGADELESFTLKPDGVITNPRSAEYMKVEIGNIRAANIDVHASNKKSISFNPIVFEIFNRPVADEAWRNDTKELAYIDTSVVGTSDYIQSKDERIRRMAERIASAYDDTLAMSRAIGTWVHENMEYEPTVRLIRAIDIFREMKGGHEEYTKLFTSLARSIGIRTQINTGLVYDEGAFRYHSWPSVFVDDYWYDLDPFYGQDAADATHIALIRGDYEKLVELLRILQMMSITILDYR